MIVQNVKKENLKPDFKIVYIEKPYSVLLLIPNTISI